WHAFLLNVLVGAGSGSFWPSQSTLLSSLTPKERRHSAFAQQRMTMNFGIALGGLVAGAVARTDHPGTFTFLFLLNTGTFLVFVVVLRLLPAVKLVEGRRRLRGLALMGVIWVGAFVAVTAAGKWLTGTQAAIVFGAAVGVFALGQCLHGAIYAPLVVDLAEPRMLGRYMAFSSASWQVGWLVGPAAGGFVLQHEPLAPWPGV